MKASDVVLQLAASLPKLSDFFTDNLNVVNVTINPIGPDLNVTVETSVDHDLSVGQGVNISGAQTPIAVATFIRVGTIGTITTSSDHDFTFGTDGGALSGAARVTADISGAVEPEFNGSFTITGVPNRSSISVDMLDSGPTSATGSVILENGSSILQSYNGTKRVDSTPTLSTFTYQLEGLASLAAPIGDITVKANARISSAISLETIIDAYTAQSVDSLWGFIVLEDVVASKNRRIISDATDNIQRSNYFRQQIIQPMSFYVVIPSAVEQIAGRKARDLAEDIFRSICQSILFKRFDSGLSVGAYNPLQFLSHGFAFYNNSFYVHQYSFEQVADILFDDTVGYDDDVAFRDIDVNFGVDIGVAELTASIDLDEVPLS